MKKVVVLIAEGFEEIEALSVVDVLRRGDVGVKILSASGRKLVVGSHGIKVKADGLCTLEKLQKARMVILPGGGPGTEFLQSYEPLLTYLNNYDESQWVGAICAAPSILANQGLLQGKAATSNPGYEDAMREAGADYQTNTVVETGNIITSRSMGTALPFALAVLAKLTDEQTVERVKQGIHIQE